ncbi:MAG: glycosyltransferase family 1 protein [Hyphomicrobiaceae bacterium]
MNVLIATDAWHPQINGVVRTLQSLAESLRSLGVGCAFLTPDGFPSVPLPSYPQLRLSLPRSREIARRIESARPDAIHIATEGPIGIAARRYCLARGLPFTTSFTTKFAEYISARVPVPVSWGYGVLRRFHAPAAVTMVSTSSLMEDLSERGFTHLRKWSRGVDVALFNPEKFAPLDLPRPIFLNVGRIAVEKNLEAFLALDLPGSKVVVGSGPQQEDLKARYRDVHFLGAASGEKLAACYAAADVFVFPSRTDTFGIVQLEALASGVPIAALPVPGPLDVVGDAPVGVLSEDLQAACIGALSISRKACRAYALEYTWEKSARQFMSNIAVIEGTSRRAVGGTLGFKPQRCNTGAMLAD